MTDRFLTLREPEFGRFGVLSSLFDNFLSPWEVSQNLDFATLSPKIDIEETDSEIKVKAELPGMDEKDIEVKVSSQGYLTIKGEKKEEHEEKSKGKYLSERRYGLVQRTIALPVDVDSDKTTAKFEKGVLNINIPKAESAKEKIKKVEIAKG